MGKFSDVLLDDYGMFVNPLKFLLTKEILNYYYQYVIFILLIISLFLLWIFYYLNFDCALHLCGNRLNFFGILIQALFLICLGFIIYKSGKIYI
jgi:hypothetical protein